MRALLLGGTRFLGRHIVDACLARGHVVTLFNRGLSDSNAYPELERIRGDRDGDLSMLREREWDMVFDTSGYDVAPARNAALAVAQPKVHYTFVSSISVYSDYSRPANESSPVKSIDDPEHVALSNGTYGALKAACELAVESALPGRVQIVRAGIILGPHDNDERFAYWLNRIARGGDVLAPGKPSAAVQFIDARDLAAWIVRGAEEKRAGVFNATGPGEPLTMAGLLETIRAVTESDARFIWAPDEVLLEDNVEPYSEMPFWLPAPFDRFSIDLTRALAAGLTLRPVIDTVRDTWDWMRTGWAAAESARTHRRLLIPAGISPEREAKLLERLRSVEVVPFGPQWHSAVIELVTEIQTKEFSLPITLDDQPDLKDVAGFYRRGAGEFWVAVDGARVAGTIALVDNGDGSASLRKMFVHADYRGKERGVAQRLLDTLFAHAARANIETIYLGTTEPMRAAHRFYEKNGFVEISRGELPRTASFARVDVKFYRRPIGA